MFLCMTYKIIPACKKKITQWLSLAYKQEKKEQENCALGVKREFFVKCNFEKKNMIR